MTNRTYRTLNEPPRLLAFTAWQWVTLLVTVAASFGLVKLTGLGVRPALTVMALVTSVVVAIALAQEPGAISPVGYLIDHARFACGQRRYPAGTRAESRRLSGVLITDAERSES